MNKSTITRERIQRIIRAINSEAYDEEEIREWLSSDEIMELSRMALAAMDSSESVELPLDYLQGHKDGLEWATKLAEANHPETGDWLYDDPIEVAKAIRKGPDMPPVQPVADSEPVAEVYQTQNAGICAPLGPSIRMLCPLEPGTNLYRHAQQPVVLDAIDKNLIEALRLVQCMLDDYRERNYGDAQGWICHINTHMSDYTEAHGDDAYSVLHNLITAAKQLPGS